MSDEPLPVLQLLDAPAIKKRWHLRPIIGALLHDSRFPRHVALIDGNRPLYLESECVSFFANYPEIRAAFAQETE